MSIQEFSSLVLNQAEGLKPFAIKLTRDPEEANDLYQETMYKAFAYRDKYHQGTNIRAWLFTIMRNIFINDYRRSNRKLVMMEEMKHLQNHFVHSSEISLRLKEIHSAIDQLPGIFKTACLLYLDGYKYHEIAQTLREPLGTIKSRIHFAKKILQKNLDR
jgi:RNA polymerase sigma factor (sigma-70 family)